MIFSIPTLVDSASRPGLDKSSISFKFLLESFKNFKEISFKFLLKIDDFRRRVDSERPGLDFQKEFKWNLIEFLKGFQKEFKGNRWFFEPRPLEAESTRGWGSKKSSILIGLQIKTSKKSKKGNQNRDTFVDSRLKTRQNAIHCTN